MKPGTENLSLSGFRVVDAVKCGHRWYWPEWPSTATRYRGSRGILVVLQRLISWQQHCAMTRCHDGPGRSRIVSGLDLVMNRVVYDAALQNVGRCQLPPSTYFLPMAYNSNEKYSYMFNLLIIYFYKHVLTNIHTYSFHLFIYLPKGSILY